MIGSRSNTSTTAEYNIDESLSSPAINILIVDDNGMNHKIAHRLLSTVFLPIQTNIYSALSAQEALDFIKNGAKFDVILMDYEMPVMKGDMATQKIREWEHDTKTSKPNCILTFSSNYPNEYFQGANGRIAKPMTPRILNQHETFKKIKDNYFTTIQSVTNTNTAFNLFTQPHTQTRQEQEHIQFNRRMSAEFT